MNISDTAIGPVGAQTLADCLHDAPLLQVLNLRGCSLLHTSLGTVSCARWVRGTLMPVNALLCDREQIQTQGVCALLRTLGEMPNLVDVDVSNNGLFGARWDKYSLAWLGTLCHEVVGAFGQFLRRNRSLVALRTSSNVLGGYYSDGELKVVDADPQVCIACVCLVIGVVCSYMSGLELVQAKFLFYGLSMPDKSLVSLDVSNNGFRGPGSAAVAQLMATNVTITDLDISSNALGRRGVRTIAAVLGRHNVLTRLNIAGNAMGDDGAKFLAQAVSTNHALVHLSMGQNAFGVEGAVAIADALRENTTLTYLNIATSECQGRGLRALADALLESNSTLAHLFVMVGMSCGACQ